jgi:hypothetical protein
MNGLSNGFAALASKGSKLKGKSSAPKQPKQQQPQEDAEVSEEMERAIMASAQMTSNWASDTESEAEQPPVPATEVLEPGWSRVGVLRLCAGRSSAKPVICHKLRPCRHPQQGGGRPASLSLP